MATGHIRARRLQTLTLVLTGVLAASLVGIVYLSVTSIPFIAVSPATDANFGTLNSCMLHALSERLGTAVSPDGTKLSAWSSAQLVECIGAEATPFPYSNVSLGAYDFSGALWVAVTSKDGGSELLLRREQQRFVEHGAVSPIAMVGTAWGLLAVDASGQVISVSSSGEVSATRQLPLTRHVQLAASADGQWVALWSGGRFAVVNAHTLESTPAEVACPVRQVWWRTSGPLMVVDCIDITLEVNALTSESALLEPRQRVPSTLLGVAGIYMEPCDVLACSAEPPR